MINFVVEQTGYPAEVVDLDADLEADLGIDSIKKAQLFGELQEYFDVSALAGNAASGTLSLDDFTTLRHVLDFLVKASPAADSKAAPAAVAPSRRPRPPRRHLSPGRNRRPRRPPSRQRRLKPRRLKPLRPTVLAATRPSWKLS